MLSVTVFAAAGCGFDLQNGEQAPVAPSAENEDFYNAGSAPSAPQPEIKPAVSPIAILDTISVPEAFGDDGTDDWSFALQTEAEAGIDLSLGWTSRISGEERFKGTLGGDIYARDLIGIRSDENSPVGADLFGAGAIGVNLRYSGPLPESEVKEKNFEASITHDADWIYADGEKISVDSLGGGFAGIDISSLSKINEAVTAVPQAIADGFNFKVGVERLIDLGFSAEVETENGISVTLTANHGFYTDLANDFLLGFLPEDWIEYIPRLDVRYTATDFVITLAFDENGLFKQFSVRNDINLEVELKTFLFDIKGGIADHGSLSVFGEAKLPAPEPTPDPTPEPAPAE